jgi:hypothetical protein
MGLSQWDCPNTATGCRFNDATDKIGGLWGCLNGTVQISRQGAGSTTPPTKVGGLWGLSQWDCPNIAAGCRFNDATDKSRRFMGVVSMGLSKHRDKVQSGDAEKFRLLF